MRTNNMPFPNMKKRNCPKLFQICSHGIVSKGPKNEFETAVDNEPSVFEPLKFYFIVFSPSRLVSTVYFFPFTYLLEMPILNQET